MRGIDFLKIFLISRLKFLQNTEMVWFLCLMIYQPL